MIVLDSLKSNELRQKYIENFVHTDSSYYRDHIEKMTQFCDGLCYTGYLWDCLIDPQIVPENELFQILKGRKNIFVMWDIHSCERIRIPDYWKYPKTNILLIDTWSDEMRRELPEDIYIFDDSFVWSAVYTYETAMDEATYCIYLKK